MDDKTLIRLHKLSILHYELNEKDLANYLGIENIDEVFPFIKSLIDRRIFSSSKRFRHKIIQKCIADGIDDERKQRYHGKAAKFYDELIKREEEVNSLSSEYRFQRYLGYAYHIFEEGRDYPSAYTSNSDLGRFLTKIGNLDLAEKCYLRALTSSKKLNNSDDEMSVLFSMTAGVYQTWGRYSEAITNYETLLIYYKKNEDKSKMSWILNNLGGIHEKQGEYDEAIAKYNESLDIARELGDKEGIAALLNNLGDKEGIAALLNNLGVIQKNKGEYDEAIAKYRESLDIAKELGDKHGISLLLNNLGMIHGKKGEYDEAIAKYRESLDIAKELGDKEGIVLTSNNLNLAKSKMKT